MKQGQNLVAATGHEILLEPLLKTSWKYFVFMGIMLALIGGGAYGYFYQLRDGMGVTGLNRPFYWGMYITNFVYFIGISHAGTLISAILRVTGAEWRRPVTRAAEAITVFALIVGAPQVLIDLGRIDRLPNVILFGRFQSPLLWDVACITTYLVGSLTYLYLPMIPDLAMCRDRMPSERRLRRAFYSLLAMGWRGTPRQVEVLEKTIGFMAIMIIPIAVSVHTVVSFIFAMTIQPMWHSTIMGPYFVIGAIFSGIAALLIAMAILRKVYNLGDYLQPLHFDNLGKLLLVFCFLWFYATGAEYLTTFYGAEPAHMSVFTAKLQGGYAPMFWFMVVVCFVIPAPILMWKRTRTIAGCVVASVGICIGMWIERYTIVVPTLHHPRIPTDVVAYYPSWVELAMAVGSFATLIFLYGLFVKIFPIVSAWEIDEGDAMARHAGTQPVGSVAPLRQQPAVTTLKTSPTTALGEARERNRRAADLPGHLSLASVTALVLVPIVGWMAWRLIEEGPFAVGLIVVAPVLASLLIMGGRCMLIIALEGREVKRQLRANAWSVTTSSSVSVQMWRATAGRDISALDRTAGG